MSHNRRHKQQRNKARKYLPFLLQKHQHKCFWCGEHIIMRRNVTDDLIIEEVHGKITFYDNGMPKSYRLASVDHLKLISDGGSNNRYNLVPACWFCNNERSNSKDMAFSF